LANQQGDHFAMTLPPSDRNLLEFGGMCTVSCCCNPQEDENTVADEENESTSLNASTRIPGIIPHFFYDLIGRILPGAYLVVGVLIILWPQDEFRRSVPTFLMEPDVLEKATGLLVFLLTVGLLLFLASAYLVGFLLGAVSYYVERIWSSCKPITLDQMLVSFGVSERIKTGLKVAFKRQFLFDLEDSDSGSSFKEMTETSTLCSYYVWAKNPNLGYMTSRWDAEALASRSVLVVSLSLFIARLIQVLIWWHCTQSFKPGWLLIFFLTGIGAIRAYEFQRRKQIQGRFSLFQALHATSAHRGAA
jgi:hypothetical protein